MLSCAQKLQLEQELDELSYMCGVCSQDMLDVENTVFSLVFVIDKLTCKQQQ